MKNEKQENFFGEVFKFALIALAVVLPIRFFVAQPFIVSGSSMDPTFMNGQYIIVDELSYRFENPKRDDVVIFNYPQDVSKYFIKRIIGLPGETVTIKGTTITIRNAAHPEGMVLQEPFIPKQSDNNLTATLKNDEYFVMGDNRPASFDSRFWGPLPKNLIIGKPFVRLLPLRTFGVFPGSIATESQS
jgi:signal peptidase I